MTNKVVISSGPNGISISNAALPSVSGNVSEIIDLINRNNKAKFPAIRFLVGESIYKLTKASERARYPGTVNVVDPEQDIFFGRIHLSGAFEASRNVSRGLASGIVASLKEIARDPAKAASEYGKKTGHCCFCLLPLSDARSLYVGYGKICASKYQLPYGEKPELA